MGILTNCQTLVQKFLYSTVYRKKTKNDLMFTSRDLVKLQKINKSSLQKGNFSPHMTVSLYMSYQSLKGSQSHWTHITSISFYVCHFPLFPLSLFLPISFPTPRLKEGIHRLQVSVTTQETAFSRLPMPTTRMNNQLNK